MSNKPLLADDLDKDTLISLKEVSNTLCLSEDEILQKIKKREFPLPIKVEFDDLTVVGFSSCQIDEWDDLNPRF